MPMANRKPNAWAMPERDCKTRPLSVDPAERTDISLANYGDLVLDSVVSDILGMSVIWIQDAHVYEHVGQTSLSFVFAGSTAGTRHTARIANCREVQPKGQKRLRLILADIQLCFKSKTTMLPIWLCESEILHAPMVLTFSDFKQLSA